VGEDLGSGDYLRGPPARILLSEAANAPYDGDPSLENEVTEIEPFIRSLQRRDTLSASDLALLQAMPLRRASFESSQELVAQGSRPKESCLVVRGFAARTQYLSQGERQITAVHVPGDFVDLHSLLLKDMDHSVVSLGRCDVAFVPHDAINSAGRESYHLARLFWMSTVIDAAIQRAWITCFGRRPAEKHLAHLICELYVRLEVVGMASGHSFLFPITQAELGDVVGLSSVHVNRKLQELRALGLIQWVQGKVTIMDFDRLAKLAEFDPTYLSLRVEPR
jgi:CRP-like cAMP-binding protein